MEYLMRIASAGSLGTARIRHVGVFLAIALLVVVPLLPVPDFWIIQLNYIGIYTLPVLGLVLLTGIGGLTSFGQAAFVGIGAYTSAVLTVHYGLSPWVSLFVGIGITCVSATLIAMITVRMSGHYLPLATLAWGLALYYLMGNLELLGKYDGINGIAGLTVFGLEIGQQRIFYALVWTCAVLSCFLVMRLLDSRAGRAIRSLSEGAQMAEAMGVNTWRYKVGIFVLAALLASISGWLFAHFQRTVNPSPFGMKMGIEYLFMAVIGGVGHVWGAIAGSGIVKLLEDQLQVLLPALIGKSGNYELVVFGILIVLVLKYLPNGVWDFIHRRVPSAARAEDWRDAPELSVRSKPAKDEVILDVRDVSKSFGGLVAVNQISFQTNAGQIVGLIGPNGAGKSTTFNLITGVLALSSGQIFFRGKNISGMSSRAIAHRGVARTFQHVKLVPNMTVLENVALGAHQRGSRGAVAAMLRLDRAEERKLLREAEIQLQRVGMGGWIHELAGGLPMGQQRLLEIARALCADPSLLLLDEPAAGLRHREKQELASVLRSLKESGIGILLVEHDMELVMGVCDHIVVMEHGTYLMEGSPYEVQQSPKVRAAYLGEVH